MEFLVSAYTDHQHRKPQILLCCQSLTLNQAIHVKLGLGFPGEWEPCIMSKMSIYCLNLLHKKRESVFIMSKINLLFDLEQMAAILDFLPIMQYLKYFPTTLQCPAYLKIP